MTTPHIHAECIKAWADGAEIERYTYKWDEWVLDKHPGWDPRYKYRIKPSLKTIKFRCYLYTSGATQKLSIGISTSEYKNRCVSKSKLFIKWLGDWQEYEIEEPKTVIFNNPSFPGSNPQCTCKKHICFECC